MTLRRLGAAPFVLALLVAAPAARAQDSDTARARALFDEAGELERRGRWSAAQDKLRAALRIRETPHLRYALGWALENDDRLLEARVEYETASRLATRTGAEDVGRLASDRLSELDRATPRVELRGARGATRVVVDGRATPLGTGTAMVPVNPGSRVIRIERAGTPSIERLIYVGRGTVHLLDVGGDGAAPVAVRGAAERRTSGPDAAPSAALPVVLTAGGAALALTGGLVFAWSTSDASDRDASQAMWCAATACTGGTTATLPESAEAARYREDANDATARGNTKQIIGATVGGLGLVAAGIGTWLLVRGRGDDARTAAVLPGIAPLRGGAALTTTLRF